jgi:hypothetical protein
VLTTDQYREGVGADLAALARPASRSRSACREADAGRARRDRSRRAGVRRGRSRADEYVIPNRRPASVRRRERSPKVIWETVRRVAAQRQRSLPCSRATRGFRRPLRRGPSRQLLALKDLLGHARLETTLVYCGARSSSQWSVCAIFRGRASAASCYSRIQ